MLKYVLLGIIQGMTEFLPVSSSGHLVIMQKVFGVNGQEIALIIFLHLGTIFALILFFFKDILRMVCNIKLLSLIFIVTVITGIIAILGKNFFESIFVSYKLVAIALIATGIVLILTKRFMNAERKTPSINDAVILGIAQAIAIIPGISRSGITISTLLFRKIHKETSFKFSFLVSIPVILTAALWEIEKIDFALSKNLINFIVGFTFSFLTGLLSLRILKKILNKTKFYLFGYYCIFIAIITLIFIK